MKNEQMLDLDLKISNLDQHAGVSSDSRFLTLGKGCYSIYCGGGSSGGAYTLPSSAIDQK